MRVKRQRWDRYIELAAQFGWTQPEVDASDPDYIEEALAYVHAKADEPVRQDRVAR